MSTGGSTAVARKMADIDVCIRQRFAAGFLDAEGKTPIRFHERLKNARRWVRLCNEAEEQTLMADKM